MASAVRDNNPFHLFALDDDASDATGAVIARKTRIQAKARAKAAAAAAEKEAAAAAALRPATAGEPAPENVAAPKAERKPAQARPPHQRADNFRGAPRDSGAEREQRPRHYNNNGGSDAGPADAGRFNRRPIDGDASGGRPAYQQRRPFGDQPPQPFVRRPYSNAGAAGAAGAGQPRPFDRKSGSSRTGVKPVDKRDGGGAHNWGNHQQDLEDATAVPAVPLAEAPDAPDAPPAPTVVVPVALDADAEAARLAAEAEARELTLDEWKAQRGERAKPQFNIRKAGEGEDVAQWKQMVALPVRKKVDSDEELEYDPSMYPQRVGRQKRLDIQLHFNDGRRNGFGAPSRPPFDRRPNGAGPFERRPFAAGDGQRRPAGQRFGAARRDPTDAPAADADEPDAPTPTVEADVPAAVPVAVRAPRANNRYDNNNDRRGYAGLASVAVPKVDDERAFPSLG